MKNYCREEALIEYGNVYMRNEEKSVKKFLKICGRVRLKYIYGGE